MPTFDIVSEVNLAEVDNALDQARREIGTRFDFKGVLASFEREENQITLIAESTFQLQQMLDILNGKLARRSVDVACLSAEEPVVSGRQARQEITLRQGVDADLARLIVKELKSSKLKVQAAIQGDKVRVSGKKRDDLQAAIAAVKAAEFEQPLQFNNFRD